MTLKSSSSHESTPLAPLGPGDPGLTLADEGALPRVAIGLERPNEFL